MPKVPIDLVLIGLHTSIYYLAHRKLLRVLLLGLDQCLYGAEPFVKTYLGGFQHHAHGARMAAPQHTASIAPP